MPKAAIAAIAADLWQKRSPVRKDTDNTGSISREEFPEVVREALGRSVGL